MRTWQSIPHRLSLFLSLSLSLSLSQLVDPKLDSRFNLTRSIGSIRSVSISSRNRNGIAIFDKYRLDI
jgi:hypothetical protein